MAVHFLVNPQRDRTGNWILLVVSHACLIFLEFNPRAGSQIRCTESCPSDRKLVTPETYRMTRRKTSNFRDTENARC
jgi:hypothetical protein